MSGKADERSAGLKCRYCGAELIHNYMCFLIMHPLNDCAFRGKESKSHWGKDINGKYGTNDFLPDSYINAGRTQTEVPDEH